MRICSIKHLAYILKCKTSEKEIFKICDELNSENFLFDGNYYREEIQIKAFENGKFKTRIFHPSKGRLKLIQSKIKSNILDKIDLPACIHGSKRNCSNITNAATHLGKKYKFKCDLKHFFPSINARMVNEVFLKTGCSPNVAHVLTVLTTYKNALPQGVSTSSYIANLAFATIDQQIEVFCKKHSLVYTRYVDDIVISSNQDFKENLTTIIAMINKGGFTISSRKTAYRHIMDITGIRTANNFLKPDAKFLKRLGEEKNVTSYNARLQYSNRVSLANKK